MMERVTLVIERCARCGKNHGKMEFKEFKRRCGKFTHFALCPDLKEPMMMELFGQPKLKPIPTKKTVVQHQETR